MRYAIMIPVLLFGLAGCASNPATTQDTPHPETSNAQPASNDGGGVAVITAKGMSCPLCATNADRTLTRLPGVNWVNINLGTGHIEVGVDEANRPSETDLQSAINDAGFTADTVTWQKPAEGE